MLLNSSEIHADYLGSEILQISEIEKKQCNFYSIKVNKVLDESVNHHILLLDVSGSMYGNMEELNKRTKATLEALKVGGNNYVSIIIYSGHEEAYRIVNAVKCDNTSYKMARVFEVLDKELYARGVTVISEPLEQAIDIIKELVEVCHKHNIALFTDGCLVPWNWSVKEEENKILKIADICKEKGIFFNAIGFGKYYDREFLKTIIDRAGTGNFNHIDEIKDYYNTITNIAKEIDNKEIINFEVSNEDYFLLNSFSRKKNKEIIRTFIDGGEFLICTFDTPLVINDKKVPKAKGKEVSEELKEDFLYALAMYHIINDDIEAAEISLAQTGDISAYSSLSNCYSFIEKGKAIQNLSMLINHKEKRFKKGKVNIKITTVEEEPLCLLEVLQDILLDKQSKLLWDYSYKYKRIGTKKQVVEDNYKFIRQKYGYGQVELITIGSKKLNIGLKVKIDGEVVNENNRLKMDAHIFRDYNLILNGNINTEYVWCTLSKELKRKFRKEKLIKGVTKVYGEEIITLDIRKLKSTNKRLLKSLNSTTIAEYLYRIQELGCKQWALNTLIKDMDKGQHYFQSVSKEEIEILKSYRIDKSGLYTPLATEKNLEERAYEVYPAKVVEWKVERFPTKKEQDKALEEYKSWIKEDDINSLKILMEELQKVKEERSTLQYKVNLVRLSCGLSNRSVFIWDNDVEKSKKETDKVLNMNVVVGEKVTISTKLINNIQIRQDSYTILTRCD